jgi:hypothetical protein
MASLSLDEFEQQILEICAKSQIIQSVAQTSAGSVWVELRAYVRDNSFVNVFYNQETNKKILCIDYSGKKAYPGSG